MTQLEKLKTLLEISDSSQDTKLTVLLELSTSDALEYCNRVSMPVETDNLIVQMAIVKYNKSGKEGSSSQSFNGVNESYIDGYTKEIYHSLDRYKKVKML